MSAYQASRAHLLDG
ncbi:hypothetical protein PENARI_c065G03511 [Penicillium arizonense]|uniref:Uncharacterized protein n=1 Tax=Penicillium arizonense TaxID=1835702 RepID=A0A1F5L235_PENAI|nr:hypothetical protein PENARI_c065G03511 [Penicillium arizonense]